MRKTPVLRSLGQDCMYKPWGSMVSIKDGNEIYFLNNRKSI